MWIVVFIMISIQGCTFCTKICALISTVYCVQGLSDDDFVCWKCESPFDQILFVRLKLLLLFLTFDFYVAICDTY